MPEPKRSAGRHAAARHAAPRTRAKRGGSLTLLRSPLVAGVAALAIAAGGAVVLNQGSGTQAVADQTGPTLDAIEGPVRGAEPRVSRSVDREVVARQVAQQAEQRESALAGITEQSEQRASTLAEEERERLENQWVLPVTGYRLTATFGQSSSLWSTVHTGQDFAAPSGTPLVALARGTVTETGYDGAYGNKTVLTLEDGTEIWYCHQSATDVAVGDEVDPGQKIGAVGSTGNVTGPHLHLEVRPAGGDPVDPMPVLREHNVTP